MRKMYILVNNYLLTQGINSVVDQFFDSREQLLKNKIELKGVVDVNGYHTSIPDRSNKESKDGRKNIVLNKGKNIARNTKCGNSVAIYKNFLFTGKIVAKQLKRIVGSELNDEETIILFQDPYIAYYAIKENIIKNPFFMSHAYEDELEQLFINYPKIKGSKLENKLRGIYKYIYKKCEVIVICMQAKHWIEQHYSGTKIDVLYNTVSTDSICDKIGEHPLINIAMASSINIRKGFDWLLDAISRIDKTKLKYVKIHIFGDGDYLPIVKKYCEENKCESLICYGRVEKPYSKYENMDAYLMVSRSETLPMGILEAMSCGLPIFSTAVGAIKELVINEYNGKLFEASRDGVIDAIEYIVRNKELLSFYGKSSREIFENKFCQEKWVINLCEILYSHPSKIERQ